MLLLTANIPTRTNMMITLIFQLRQLAASSFNGLSVDILLREARSS
jgi:hypothetical protein